MNGDGRNDVVKNTGLNTPHAGERRLPQQPPATPPSTCSRSPITTAPYFASVGDLNNDNRLDIVETDDGADRYLLNQGNDALGPRDLGPARRRSASPRATDDGFGSQSLIVDLDQDGWKDVLISDVDVDDPTRLQHGRRLPGRAGRRAAGCTSTTTWRTPRTSR